MLMNTKHHGSRFALQAFVPQGFPLQSGLDKIGHLFFIVIARNEAIS